MASIKLIVETGIPQIAGPKVGFPLKITAEGTGVTSHIFVYQQLRGAAPNTAPYDMFSHVASLPELEYPEGAADLAQENPWSRHASVELSPRTLDERNEIVSLVTANVRQLLAAFNAPRAAVEEIVL
jgi:hypothetical protein